MLSQHMCAERRDVTGSCLSYCSIAGKRHYDQGSLLNKMSIGSHGSRGLAFMIIMVRSIAAGRQPWCRSSKWWLTYWSASWRQKEEKDRGLIENDTGFWNLTCIPSDTTPSSRPHLLTLIKQFLHVGTKNLNLWSLRIFSFNSHQSIFNKCILSFFLLLC